MMARQPAVSGLFYSAQPERLAYEVDQMLQGGQFKATFLPQVWLQLSEPEEFVHRLKQKAGLAVDHWSQSMQCSVYQVQEIHE